MTNASNLAMCPYLTKTSTSNTVENSIDTEAPKAIPATPMCFINKMLTPTLTSNPTTATALIAKTCLVAVANLSNSELHTKKGICTTAYCITRVTNPVASLLNVPPSNIRRTIGSDHIYRPALMGTETKVANNKKNDNSRLAEIRWFLATSAEKY